MQNLKQKKIAFVIGALNQGGAERVVSILGNGLIGEYEISIITFIKIIPFYNLDKRIKVISCMEAPYESKSFLAALSNNYKLILRTYQILKKEKADLVIGFITSANIIATLAAKLARIPVIISERNNPKMEYVPKFWRLLRKLVYPMANKVVLQTYGIHAYYSKKLNASKLVVLPNPIASELVNMQSDTLKRENIVLSVGRLDKNKRHDLLIKAFAEINDPDWDLIILGEGDFRKELETLITDLGLESKVKLPGAVREIAEYYKLASIFAFTSVTEGFPNALLEAMSFGLPSIAADCEYGPSDLIKDNENGFLIPVNNINVLKKRLNQLMQSKQTQKILGSKGQESTLRFNTDNVLVQWSKLIENSFIKLNNL